MKYNNNNNVSQHTWFHSCVRSLQDVLVLGTSALQPGSIVEIRALGYMVMGE